MNGQHEHIPTNPEKGMEASQEAIKPLTAEEIEQLARNLVEQGQESEPPELQVVEMLGVSSLHGMGILPPGVNPNALEKVFLATELPEYIPGGGSPEVSQPAIGEFDAKKVPVPELLEADQQALNREILKVNLKEALKNSSVSADIEGLVLQLQEMEKAGMASPLGPEIVYGLKTAGSKVEAVLIKEDFDIQEAQEAFSLLKDTTDKLALEPLPEPTKANEQNRMALGFRLGQLEKTTTSLADKIEGQDESLAKRDSEKIRDLLRGIGDSSGKKVLQITRSMNAIRAA